jgi:hypothetical protein
MYTNSLVNLMYTCPIIFFRFFLLIMSVWVQKTTPFFLSVFIYIFTFSQSKKQRGGTLHLFTYCQGEFTLFSSFAHLLRLAWWWQRRVYIHIHTQEYADSPLHEQILTILRRELSFDFFYVHIHTDANLSDEDDVDINTQSVRFVHRMIWSIIHYSSTFAY